MITFSKNNDIQYAEHVNARRREGASLRIMTDMTRLQHMVMEHSVTKDLLGEAKEVKQRIPGTLCLNIYV